MVQVDNGGDKSSNPHLAGGKGEGYKAAAAVALAEGYQYRYEASSCYWKFHIGGKNDPEQIYCELKPMRQNALANVIASYEREVITASSRNEEKSYIHKDVTVKNWQGIPEQGIPWSQHHRGSFSRMYQGLS